jgi:hypothetical protein
MTHQQIAEQKWIEAVGIVRNVDPFGSIRQDLRSQLQNDFAKALYTLDSSKDKEIEELKRLIGKMAHIDELTAKDKLILEQAELIREMKEVLKLGDCEGGGGHIFRSSGKNFHPINCPFSKRAEALSKLTKWESQQSEGERK